ncbi:GumC family protein [Spirulina subsalsa]|uniref:GumC family protein n=1 Tax=Spirulina subsalsa TaxID=54311 RepID=UPI002238CBDA|nr:polysaccharide biosynthesis tyrosine autokinase [Spirulina subsalsa]
MQTENSSPSSSHVQPSVPYPTDDEGGMQLGQLVDALSRQVLLIIGLTLVMASLGYLRARNQPTVYQASFELLTQPVTLETKIISSVSPEALSSREEIVAVQVDDVRLKLLRSPDLLGPIAEDLSLKYPGFHYGILNAGLVIRNDVKDVLSVGYTSSNPQLVEDVLQRVSEAYLQHSLDERQSDIRQGINFVEDQLPHLRQRVDSQQERLQKIRQANNLVNPEMTGQQLSTQISAVEQQQLNTQVQLDELRALYEDLTHELVTKSPEQAAASVLRDNPRYQGLLGQLQQIDNEIAQQSVLYLENSPEIRLLQEQRASLIPLLYREAERVQAEMLALIRELEKRNNALNLSANRLSEQIKQLSIITREYTDIQRELQIATDNLNQFLSKREALRIDAAQRERPWRLLSPAGEPKPSRSSAKKNGALGAIVGLMLGCGVALALDKLNDTLYSYQEIKKASQLPLLGVIPWQKEITLVPAEGSFTPTRSPQMSLEGGLEESVSPVQPFWEAWMWLQGVLPPIPFVSRPSLGDGVGSNRRYESLMFAEAFRSLCTNIRLLSPDHWLRSFVITSSEPEEGKSTVAVHLAIAAAAMDQRVLLVDTDLRRPRVHTHLGLINAYGLTNVLAGELDVNSAIQRSPLEENLSILTTGSMPPDPIRLIASQKMENLMHKLSEAFDLVIYDAPPVLGLADSHLIATHTDGVILVAGLGQIKRSVLEQALYDLRVSSNPLLGIIANRSKTLPSRTPSDYARYTPAESNLTPWPTQELAPHPKTVARVLRP